MSNENTQPGEQVDYREFLHIAMQGGLEKLAKALDLKISDLKIPTH